MADASDLYVFLLCANQMAFFIEGFFRAQPQVSAAVGRR